MTGVSRRRSAKFGMLVVSTFALALVVTPSGSFASSLTLLDVPRATLTEANGINSNGSVVGDYMDSAGKQHGFLWVNGTFTTIDVPFPGVIYTIATGISGPGRIVGIYEDTHGFHGFLLDGGTYTTIDVPWANGFSVAYGISSKGIVGYYTVVGTGGTLVQGFLLAGGTYTVIDVSFPDATDTAPLGIDSKGRIVGQYRNGTGVHGYLWDGSSFIRIVVPGAVYTAVEGVASPGGIVGWYEDVSGTAHAFFTPNGITAPTNIDPCGNSGTGRSTLATGINTNGFIVGACDDAFGRTHAFVWKP